MTCFPPSCSLAGGGIVRTGRTNAELQRRKGRKNDARWSATWQMGQARQRAPLRGFWDRSPTPGKKRGPTHLRVRRACGSDVKLLPSTGRLRRAAPCWRTKDVQGSASGATTPGERAPLMLFRLGSDRPAHELPSLLGESSARDGSRTRRYRGEQGSGVWAGWLRGRLHRMTYVSVLCVLISLNPGTFASGFTGNTEKSFVFQFTK